MRRKIMVVPMAVSTVSLVAGIVGAAVTGVWKPLLMIPAAFAVGEIKFMDDKCDKPTVTPFAQKMSLFIRPLFMFSAYNLVCQALAWLSLPSGNDGLWIVSMLCVGLIGTPQVYRAGTRGERIDRWTCFIAGILCAIGFLAGRDAGCIAACGAAMILAAADWIGFRIDSKEKGGI